MLRIVSAMLFAVFASSIPSSSDILDEMQPVCVCAECKQAPAIKDVKHALLLGEAYARVVFGGTKLYLNTNP